MSESETLYQVLYIRNGEEMFSYAEPYEDAKKRANQMEDSGLEVLSVMSQQGSTEYINQKMRRAQGNMSRMVATLEDFRKTHRDEGAKADDTQSDLSQTLDRAARVQRTKLADRRISVDYALRLREGTEDTRTADELVKDAETILKFLEG